MYSEKVIEHFKNPKHVGEIENADGIGEAGNVQCGDQMRVYIKVKNNKIIDCRFLTYGCCAAIASSDVLCDLAIGKTIEDAEKITNKDIVKELGDLPALKFHCSVLGQQTLRKAIQDYKTKSKTK